MATSEQTLGEYLDINYASRDTAKPRDFGITMVMDQAWPNNFTLGVLEAFGPYLDIVKLWDPHVKVPVSVVAEKVEMYRHHNVIVQPGGLFLEIARRDGRYLEVLKQLKALGFDAVEVSSTTSTRGAMESDKEAVDIAKQLGFRVYGEVGRKFFDGDATRLTEDTLDIDRTVEEFNVLIEAGAEKVYWEGHLLRKVVGDDPDTIKAHAGTGTAQVVEVARQVGLAKVMFEVSGLRPRANRQWLQFWLVRLFGPEVNLANARVEEMPSLEAIRAGSHPIFGFGAAGNYAWVRASGEGRDEWWRG